MIPILLAEKIADLIPIEPKERLAFWTGFKAGMKASSFHSSTELTAMTDVEIGHATKACMDDVLKFPKRPDNGS